MNSVFVNDVKVIIESQMGRCLNSTPYSYASFDISQLKARSYDLSDFTRKLYFGAANKMIICQIKLTYMSEYYRQSMRHQWRDLMGINQFISDLVNSNHTTIYHLYLDEYENEKNNLESLIQHYCHYKMFSELGHWTSCELMSDNVVNPILARYGKECMSINYDEIFSLLDSAATYICDNKYVDKKDFNCISNIKYMCAKDTMVVSDSNGVSIGGIKLVSKPNSLLLQVISNSFNYLNNIQHI